MEIQKAGKKVSNKNLEALKAAQKALAAVISEAEPETKLGEKEPSKGEKEEEEVKKEELTEIMKQTMEDALKPINDRLDKIEKADSGREQEEVKEVFSVSKLRAIPLDFSTFSKRSSNGHNALVIIDLIISVTFSVSSASSFTSSCSLPLSAFSILSSRSLIGFNRYSYFRNRR